MHEAIDMALEEAKDQMEKALERLSGELRKLEQERHTLLC